MSLEIRETEREGVVILALKGRLTVGEASSVREKITEVQAKGRHQIILDLNGVDYIDSTGLGSMVICFTSVKKAGRRAEAVESEQAQYRAAAADQAAYHLRSVLG